MLALLRFCFYLLLFCAVNGAAAFVILVSAMYPNLPDLARLEDYRPRLPLRVFAANGELLGEFGEEKRQIVGLDEIPPLLVDALVATEDQDFHTHLGLDLQGIVRTVITRLQGGSGGASTLTMQVARNFYLDRIQTYERKFYEILLALKIENRFSKRRILEFYMNQIYLGRGSYGFAAAAKAYYGKEMAELGLAEIAVLAGLPQAPSRLNPARNPGLAKERQKHVLRRMRDTGIITPAEFLEAAAAPLPPVIDLSANKKTAAATAGYVAEEVRKIVFDSFGDEAYERGFRVHTSIDMRLQQAAVTALRKGLVDYTERHAYAGPERYHDIAGLTAREAAALLEGTQIIGGLVPAVVLQASPELVLAVDRSGTLREIAGAGLKFVRKALAPDAAGQTLRPGAQVRLDRRPLPAAELAKVEKRIAELAEGEEAPPAYYYSITQLPAAEGALVAVSPDDGRLLAMAGGFDFAKNQYNHVTQARRQPGSSIKPFIYSAAIERGYTPATILDDAPFFLTAEQTGSGRSWAPKNYGGKYDGKMLLRDALARSKNMTTIRVLDSIGPQYAQDYILRFGFERDSLPPYLTMGLGAGEVTPMQLAAGYGVFANGGYLVTPHFITRIEDQDGGIVSYGLDFEQRKQIIDRRNAFMVSSLLRSVVDFGTGVRARRELGRGDLGGKTGTTNETVDAWFAGFNPEVAAVAWVGFDTPKSLGRLETGARAALPVWIDFMGAALGERPEGSYLQPAGVVEALIDAQTGLLAVGGEEETKLEYFYEENLPAAPAAPAADDLSSELL